MKEEKNSKQLYLGDEDKPFQRSRRNSNEVNCNLGYVEPYECQLLVIDEVDPHFALPFQKCTF